jgi:hypothetical protein
MPPQRRTRGRCRKESPGLTLNLRGQVAARDSCQRPVDSRGTWAGPGSRGVGTDREAAVAGFSPSERQARESAEKTRVRRHGGSNLLYSGFSQILPGVTSHLLATRHQFRQARVDVLAALRLVAMNGECVTAFL